jgi:predicted nucleic acid-binding protein
LRDEWGAFGVVEVDQRLAETAAELALAHDLRGLDALHLAAATLLRSDALVVASWDRRLRAAARQLGLELMPACPP